MKRADTIFRAALLALAVVFVPGNARAHDLLPGLYEITVRVALPNVLGSAASTVLRRCISPADIESHTAFRILSDNPLAKCPHTPMCMGELGAGFQVLCPGPGGGFAEAKFQITAQAFTGTIRMDMGGKNMTIIEYQDGRRVGVCDK